MAAVRLFLFFACSTLYVTSVSSIQCYFCDNCPLDPSTWPTIDCTTQGASFTVCIAGSDNGRIMRSCYNRQTCSWGNSNLWTCTCDTDLCNDKDFGSGTTTAQPNDQTVGRTVVSSASLNVSFSLLTFVAVLTSFLK